MQNLNKLTDYTGDYGNQRYAENKLQKAQDEFICNLKPNQLDTSVDDKNGKFQADFKFSYDFYSI